MERATEYSEHKYKIILLGAVGVGKTSIFNRLKTGKFEANATAQAGTVGVDIYNYTTTVGNDRIHVSQHVTMYDRLILHGSIVLVSRGLTLLAQGLIASARIIFPSTKKFRSARLYVRL